MNWKITLKARFGEAVATTYYMTDSVALDDREAHGWVTMELQRLAERHGTCDGYTLSIRPAYTMYR